MLDVINPVASSSPAAAAQTTNQLCTNFSTTPSQICKKKMDVSIPKKCYIHVIFRQELWNGGSRCYRGKKRRDHNDVHFFSSELPWAFASLNHFN